MGLTTAGEPDAGGKRGVEVRENRESPSRRHRHRRAHLQRRQQTAISEDRFPELIECHRAIYRAIVRKDEALAEDELREHFDFSSKLETEQKLKGIVARSAQGDG
ncbi:FCD domain-containing protein [Rhodobacteraceae bacterium 2CG4]|uniref:FCD domain-containing protein n=1 Tax=Halovulum marinum TaxID=2662447 RepID=A0A6L5Z4B6_9RHOB|nr:FCD domain-containing protein [Halovulum marinum]